MDEWVVVGILVVDLKGELHSLVVAVVALPEEMEHHPAEEVHSAY